MKTKHKHKRTYFIWFIIMIVCAVMEFTMGIANNKMFFDTILNVIVGLIAIAYAISELIYYNRDKNYL